LLGLVCSFWLVVLGSFSGLFSFWPSWDRYVLVVLASPGDRWPGIIIVVEHRTILALRFRPDVALEGDIFYENQTFDHGR